MNRRWFDKAISFACTSCGKCCKSYNNQIKVYLNTIEAIQISDHIGADIDEFQKKYIDIHYDQHQNELISLKSNENKTNCIFLKQNQCSIYEVRPTQCRTYPYWPQHMLGKNTWLKEASSTCEGMSTIDNHNALHKVHQNTRNTNYNNIIKNDIELINISDINQSSSPTSSLDVASREDILLNMIVHTIHDRGLGIENWTYDEAYTLLKESINESPELLDEFESDFFESNKINIVYETPLLRIVDAKTAAAAVAPSKDEISYDYSRRMEFVNASQLTQTEMYFDQVTTSSTTNNNNNNNNNNVSIIHSKLVMPVHQVISSVVIEYMNLLQSISPNIAATTTTTTTTINTINTTNTTNNTNTTQLTIPSHTKLALIGAGCCALPQYLLCDTIQNKYQSLQSLSIDAIEPEEQVLDVAEKYFNICFDNNRLVKYNMDGSTFLNIALNSSDNNKYNNNASMKYDIIIIDAFSVDSESKNDNRITTSYAPPSQLLKEWYRFSQLLQNNASSTTNTTTNNNNTNLSSSSSSSSLQINGGILIMNVYGSQDWMNNVELQIQQSNIFCQPIILNIDNLMNYNNYYSINNNTIITDIILHNNNPKYESDTTLINKNAVFILMLKEDEQWLSSIIKYIQSSKL